MNNNEEITLDTMNVGELIALIDTKSRRDVDACCNRLGMLQLEVIFLKRMYMFEDKQISLKDIEKLLQVTQSDVTRISRKLEEKELVYKFADPTDFRKRRVIMRLTEKGCQYAERFFDNQKFMGDILLKNISAEEQIELKRLLRQIYDNIKGIKPLKDLMI